MSLSVVLFSYFSDKRKLIFIWTLSFWMPLFSFKLKRTSSRKPQLLTTWWRQAVSITCSLLWTDRTLFTSLRIPEGFPMSCGCWSRMLGQFRLRPPSCTTWLTYPRFHAAIDTMPDKMNSDVDSISCIIILWISRTRLWPGPGSWKDD